MESTHKKCYYCAEQILQDAKICRFCNRDVFIEKTLEKEQPETTIKFEEPVPDSSDESRKYLLIPFFALIVLATSFFIVYYKYFLTEKVKWYEQYRSNNNTAIYDIELTSYSELANSAELQFLAALTGEKLNNSNTEQSKSRFICRELAPIDTNGIVILPTISNLLGEKTKTEYNIILKEGISNKSYNSIEEILNLTQTDLENLEILDSYFLRPVGTKWTNKTDEIRFMGHASGQINFDSSSPINKNRDWNFEVVSGNHIVKIKDKKYEGCNKIIGTCKYNLFAKDLVPEDTDAFTKLLISLSNEKIRITEKIEVFIDTTISLPISLEKVLIANDNVTTIKLSLNELTKDLEDEYRVSMKRIGSNLNFRSTPEVTGGNIIGKLKDTDKVKVINRINDDWLEVKHKEQLGFISSKYILYPKTEYTSIPQDKEILKDRNKTSQQKFTKKSPIKNERLNRFFPIDNRTKYTYHFMGMTDIPSCDDKVTINIDSKNIEKVNINKKLVESEVFHFTLEGFLSTNIIKLMQDVFEDRGFKENCCYTNESKISEISNCFIRSPNAIYLGHTKNGETNISVKILDDNYNIESPFGQLKGKRTKYEQESIDCYNGNTSLTKSTRRSILEFRGGIYDANSCCNKLIDNDSGSGIIVNFSEFGISNIEAIGGNSVVGFKLIE